MADINQRIVLSGADEVRRGLEAIGQAGERSGNTIRATLLAATQGTNAFTASTRNAAATSGQMRFALQNLGFQVNDVATSLASGISPMRTFAQQGGQVIQVFQQGGGFRAVLGGAASAIAAFITPTTAAVAAFAALAVGIGVLISRAASADAGARQFQVILDGMRKSSLSTGKELERVAESFRDIGISANEGRDLVEKFIRAGGDPRRAQQAIRVAADVQAVLGTSIEEFVQAAGKGGPALEEFAKRLGIVPGISREVQQQLDAAAKSADNFRKSLIEAQQAQADQLRDLARTEKRAQEDRDRLKRQQFRGITPEQQQEEDQAIEHARRIEDINRQSAERINQLLAARNAENAKQLTAYNETVLAEAQKALDTGNSLLDQIAQAVSGASTRTLSPFQQSIRDLSVAWNDLLDTMSKSEIIQIIVSSLGNLVVSIKDAIQWVDKLIAAWKQVPGLPAFLGGAGMGATLPGMAAGGQVRGPGTGTSDSVPIWASNGEFVVNAFAARMNLPILHAINSMRAPIMPRLSRGFAMGGLVTAGAGAGAAVHIHLDGGSFPLTGERGVVNALSRAARKAALLSAGKRASTA